MKKLTKITVAIPAFNESVNIESLVSSLTHQKSKLYEIEKILIISDGSTDDTVERIHKLKDKRVVLIQGRSRIGVAKRQNQLFMNSNSEILVLLNADIHISDRSYLEKLIMPIILNEADMTSSNLRELRPSTHFEKVIFVSMQLKNFLFEQYKNGNNVYTCRGPARAFRRDLYNVLKFESSIGEDAFSYFFCITNGFRFKSVRTASIVYKLPDNYVDHERQSIRFRQSKELLKKRFGESAVSNEYSFPTWLILYAGIRYFLKFPTFMLLYITILIEVNVRSVFKKSNNSDTWDVSMSSKLLNIVI